MTINYASRWGQSKPTGAGSTYCQALHTKDVPKDINEEITEGLAKCKNTGPYVVNMDGRTYTRHVEYLQKKLAEMTQERDDYFKGSCANLKSYQKALDQAMRTCTCLFCDWREVAESREAAHAAVRAHVLVCPNHPMRAVEKERKALLKRTAILAEMLLDGGMHAGPLAAELGWRESKDMPTYKEASLLRLLDAAKDYAWTDAQVEQRDKHAKTVLAQQMKEMLKPVMASALLFGQPPIPPIHPAPAPETHCYIREGGSTRPANTAEAELIEKAMSLTKSRNAALERGDYWFKQHDADHQKVDELKKRHAANTEYTGNLLKERAEVCSALYELDKDFLGDFPSIPERVKRLGHRLEAARADKAYFCKQYARVCDVTSSAWKAADQFPHSTDGSLADVIAQIGKRTCKHTTCPVREA